MSFEPTNRMAGLLDNPLPGSTRSPAQQEASRSNGRLSRGPRTATGKSRSKMNAAKHGLFARVTAPPGEYNENRKLHRHFHQDLIAEFNPKSFSQQTAIAGLAGDYVQLARVRRMVEALALPMALSPRDKATYEHLVQAKSDARLLEQVIAAYDAGEPPRSPARQAKRLAASIGRGLELLLSDLVEPDEEPGQDTEPVPQDQSNVDRAAEGQEQNLLAILDGQDADDFRPLRKWITNLELTLPWLHDQTYVEAVLLGRKRLRKTEHQPFRAFLAYSLLSRRRWVQRQSGLVEDTRRLNASNVRVLAQEPERLMALDQFVHRLEHAIDRKLRQISRW